MGISKSTLTLLLPILLSVSLFGCSYRMNQIMSSWEGNDVDDLIASWGPPTQVLDDGNGGKIFCYQQSGTVYMPGTTTTTGNAYRYGNQVNYNEYTSSTPGYAVPVNKYRMFWVNPNGIIYKWSWRGL